MRSVSNIETSFWKEQRKSNHKIQQRSAYEIFKWRISRFWVLSNIETFLFPALVNILLTVLNIEVLSTIITKLILHNRHRHITLMIDHLANHLSIPDQINKHIIMLMKIIYLVFILIAGMTIMMILCLIAIQCENDYISMYLWMYFVKFIIFACILICFYRRRAYLYFHFMFSVISDMFWICDTWILMSTFFLKICRDFFRIFWAFYVA